MWKTLPGVGRRPRPRVTASSTRREPAKRTNATWVAGSARHATPTSTAIIPNRAAATRTTPIPRTSTVRRASGGLDARGNVRAVATSVTARKDPATGQGDRFDAHPALNAGALDPGRTWRPGDPSATMPP